MLQLQLARNKKSAIHKYAFKGIIPNLLYNLKE